MHCPYCHGWEVRDHPVGILASGPRAVHQALLFRQLTADVTLFLHTAASPSDEQRDQLTARDITVVEGEVESLEITDGHLPRIHRLALVVCRCGVEAAVVGWDSRMGVERLGRAVSGP
jgi:thioredoxin reductase